MDVLEWIKVGEMDVMLCNNNILVIVEGRKEMVKIMLEECLNIKGDLNFSKVRYGELVEKGVGVEERGLFVLDDSGYVFYIPLNNPSIKTALNISPAAEQLSLK